MNIHKQIERRKARKNVRKAKKEKGWSSTNLYGQIGKTGN